MRRGRVRTWRYFLPNVDGQGWAIFLIDSVGTFTCVSDYGNYAYRWPPAGFHGHDFRAEIIRMHSEYVLRKVTGERRTEFNDKKTRKGIMQAILEYRRQGDGNCGIKKELARSEWDLAKDIEDQESFEYWMRETEFFNHDGCAYEYACWDYTCEQKTFAYTLVPKLQELIRAELKREKTQQPRRLASCPVV